MNMQWPRHPVFAAQAQAQAAYLALQGNPQAQAAQQQQLLHNAQIQQMQLQAQGQPTSVAYTQATKPTPASINGAQPMSPPNQPGSVGGVS